MKARHMRYFTFILALCFLAAGCQPKSTATKSLVTEETLQELRDYIRLEVAAGFEPEETIAANVVEILSDDYDSALLTPHAVEITRELIAAHRREQASWPETTDCDRLDAAFAELERSGVVCRQNFTCCGTCGADEIKDQMQVARSGKQVRGYTFYHMQDTESAVDGDGLPVEWDGTWAKRIAVTMDWKRRR